MTNIGVEEGMEQLLLADEVDGGKELAQEAKRILMDLVHYRTYAGTKASGQKENRTEVIDRVKGMHIAKFPWLKDEIEEVFKEVYAGRVVPSMRSMQFGGLAILRSNARAFNCSYASLTSWKDFADLFWLMMNGVGTGYSVQKQHIENLPRVWVGRDNLYEVEDTKEGWANGLFYLLSNPSTRFDFSKVRAKGSPISAGGTASGPESLAEAYEKIRVILFNAQGRQLTSVECFDIMCHMADVVVVGGVRRAATIGLFGVDDQEMLHSKSGAWWIENPQRARANISAVVDKTKPDYKETISRILDVTFASGSGEPGIFLTNNKDLGTNPCAEISLSDHGLCNLSEINVAACKTRGDFLAAVKSATALGTLQATYTDYDYVQSDWSTNAKKEALLGVSLTGQAENWDLLSEELLQTGARFARVANRLWAEKLEINTAERITTTKPSGSTSAWFGTTSGIHAAHAPFYLRRVRVDRKDAFGQYLINTFGEQSAGSNSFIEADAMAPENIIVTIPMAMNGAIMRDEETSVELMERAKHIHSNWIKNGHVKGDNTHNVSLTVSFKEDEKDEIKEWMLENTDSWAGISLLPYDGGTYTQSPFQTISEFEYHQWLRKIPLGVDFSSINFAGEEDTRLGDLACVNGNCEVI